jgi:lysine-N-methylase
MTQRRFLSLRYLEEFRCIGTECEDNCCHSWSVYVDQSTHQRLKKAMKDDARFTRLELLPPEKRGRDRFARITLEASGDCPMLDDKRLCVIQGRLGEKLLPEVCRTYPRKLSLVGLRAELTGLLSCPELVRKALLSESATEVREATPMMFAEIHPERALDLVNATPWQSLLDEIRGTLYQLFADERYPVGSRLYFALSLAERIDGFCHAESENIDGERLKREVLAVESGELREALHQRFRSLPGEAPLAVSILAQAVAARLVMRDSGGLKPLLDQVFAQYAADGGVNSTAAGEWQLSPEQLAESYRRRWAKLRERSDLWFGNYARHYVFHEWYTEVATLGLYVQTLALRLALFRFLLAGHPLAEEKPEAALVAVVYTISRAIDHNPGFVEALAKVMRAQLGTQMTIALLKL